MKIYKVGGCVRDILLGLEPSDIDYLVVGSNESEMLSLGFTQVGKSFPVFLKDNQEYALARTEEKQQDSSSPSFNFNTNNVDVVQDLKRRDLTINSMAMDESGTIIDPYNGQADLHNKILRHTSNKFSEDPLRVLRLARFASKFPEFSIAKETTELLKGIVKTEEFRNIPPERVSKEMFLALKTERPSRFFYVLKEIGALNTFFPWLNKLVDVPQNPIYHPEGCAFTHTMLVLDSSIKTKSKLKEEIVFCSLVHDLGKGVTPKEILPAHIGHDENGIHLIDEFCDQLKISNRLRDLAKIVCKYHIKYYQIEKNSSASGLIKMLHGLNAYKNNDNLEALIEVGIADHLGKNRLETIREKTKLEKALEISSKISFKDIDPTTPKDKIKALIWEKRVNSVKDI